MPRSLFLLWITLVSVGARFETVNNQLVLEEEKLDVSFGPCAVKIHEPCPDDDVLFYLFTSEDPETPQLMNLTESDAISTVDFDPDRPTKIIVHGFNGHLDYLVTAEVRKAYLRRGSFNVISVDWSPLARSPCYPTAVINTVHVGKCIGQLVERLVNDSGANYTDVHIIGFSLGAHVAGFAANFLSNGTLGRITGLDPALPFFSTLHLSWKLDSTDADFVDIIHTNAGLYGKLESTGHADFYVNGGQMQPACSGNWNRPKCSHMIAPLYYAESVTSEVLFWGAPCRGLLYYLLGWCTFDGEGAVMGDPCPSETRGIFFVQTNEEPPFALGKPEPENEIETQVPIFKLGLPAVSEDDLHGFDWCS